MAVVNCVVFNDIVIVNVLIIDDFCQKKTSLSQCQRQNCSEIPRSQKQAQASI